MNNTDDEKKAKVTHDFEVFYHSKLDFFHLNKKEIWIFEPFDIQYIVFKVLQSHRDAVSDDSFCIKDTLNT